MKHVLVMETTPRRGAQPWPRAWLARVVVTLGCAALLAAGGWRVVGTVPVQRQPATGPRVAPAAQVRERSGPADEYLQADGMPTPLVPPRSGPADEYAER